MKTLLARWIARRLAIRARALRRSPRDYQRREYAYIRVLEKRSRGLRLYVAWVRKKNAVSIREAPERWQLPQVTAGAFHENVNAAAYACRRSSIETNLLQAKSSPSQCR